MAETAEATVPWPVTKITSACGEDCLVRFSSSRPSISAIFRSVMTMSNESFSIIFAP